MRSVLARWLGGRAAPAPAPRIELEPGGEAFTAAPGRSILQAALAAGIPFPHSCKVGTCASCKCRLISGSVRAVRDFSYVLSEDEIRAGAILACQAVPQGDVRIRLAHRRSGLQVPTRTIAGRVARVAALAPDVCELRIALDEPMHYRAGQFADLSFEGLERPRSYSFAEAPADDGAREIVFHVRLYGGGRVSSWLLAGDRTGAPVRVSGPFGTFWLRDGERPILCVAGGSGMAPIRAMLEAAARQGMRRDAVFVYGARTREHLYGGDAIERIAASWSGSLRFLPALSDEPAASDWTGARGLVTESLAPGLVDYAGCDAYLCGPPAMIDRALERLRALGADPDHVHHDKFLDARQLDAGAARG